MDRSERNFGSESYSRPGKRPAAGAQLAVRPPGWTDLAQYRKPWTRIKMAYWPFAVARPSIDNSLAEGFERCVSTLSRALGPILLVAALAGIVWAILRWMG